jgi:[ribosomal protein S5]-alanine N-acetyltransferase
MNDAVFDQFPVIVTERLVLREITRDDIDRVFKIYSDQEVVKYLGKDVYKSIDEAEYYVTRERKAFEEKKGIRWAISLKNDNSLIGCIGYWRILKEHFRAEVGYHLSPEFWRKGIMTEAFSTLIKFAFHEMNLHSIEANIDPDNYPSERLLKKLGFKQEALFKENYFYNGKFIDSAIYSLLNSK